MRGILISREVAKLLAADYDGDRISVTSAKILGGVKEAVVPSPMIIGNNGEAANIKDLIAYMDLTPTGDKDVDNLVAATTGRRIGFADSQASNLMFHGYKEVSLAYATYVEQAVINSVKHKQDGIIDLSQTYKNVCDFLGVSLKKADAPKLYKLFTGKLTVDDIRKYVPALDPVNTVGTPVFAGVETAVTSAGLDPWILNIDIKKSQSAWVALVDTAKYSISKVDPDSFGLGLPYVETIEYGKHVTHPDYYRKALAGATPILRRAFVEVDKATAADKRGDRAASLEHRIKAREIIRTHMDASYYKITHEVYDLNSKFRLATVTYLHYVAVVIARLWANNGLYPALMQAFTAEEIAAAVAYLRTVHKMRTVQNIKLSKLNVDATNAADNHNYDVAKSIREQMNALRRTINVATIDRPDAEFNEYEFITQLLVFLEPEHKEVK